MNLNLLMAVLVLSMIDRLIVAYESWNIDSGGKSYHQVNEGFINLSILCFLI